MLKFFASLSRWDWFDLIGVALVFVGVVGEIAVPLIKFKPTPNPEAKWAARSGKLDLLRKLAHRLQSVRERQEKKMKRWEHLAQISLVIGLALELVALPHHFKEAAELKDSAASANERAAELENEAAQATERAAKLEARVSGLNPLTRPVVSISAFAHIGFSNQVSNKKMVGNGPLGEEIIRAEVFFWSVRKYRAFGMGPPTVRLITDKVSGWQGVPTESFMTLSTPHTFELAHWPKKETAGELLDMLDSVELHPWFIADEGKICTGGFVVLTINSSLTKRFEIPAQTTKWWGEPIFGTDTNTVNYDPKTSALVFPKTP